MENVWINWIKLLLIASDTESLNLSDYFFRVAYLLSRELIFYLSRRDYWFF